VLACTVADSSPSGRTSASADVPRSSLRRDGLSNVRPLRPIRVLLAGRDARYLRAMAFLFDHRGYETSLNFKPGTLFEDVDAFRPEVVVLVEADSFGDAIGQARALLASRERLHVVVSTSRPDAPDTGELRFVAKWGPFPSLADAVERAWADLPAY
jgi:hypothetical protein